MMFNGELVRKATNGEAGSFPGSGGQELEAEL